MPWIFLALAVICLFLEFFLPGTIFGLIASITFLNGLIFACISYSPWHIGTYILVSVVVGSGTVLFALKRLKKNPSFTLSTHQDGFVASSFDPKLVGKEGIAESDLSPSGFAIVDSKRVQVISSGRYITKGSPIKVLSGKGSYLVVQEHPHT